MREHEIEEYVGAPEVASPLAKTVQTVLAKSAPVLSVNARQLARDLFGDEEDATANPPASSSRDALFAKAVEIANRVAALPLRKQRITAMIKALQRDLLSKGFKLNNTQVHFDRLQLSCEKFVNDAVQSAA